MNEIDPLDITILDVLQQDIPLVSRPWEVLANRIGISESVLLERLKRLCQAGIIRGISPVIESRSLGINAATLVAFPVPEEKICEVAEIINQCPEVSHNFRREHHYSLWFTLAARDKESLNKILDTILTRTGFSENTILNLPTVQKIKVDVRFPITRKREGITNGSA